MKLSGVSVFREYAKNLSVKSRTRSRLFSFSNLKVSNTMTAMYGISHQLSELDFLHFLCKHIFCSNKIAQHEVKWVETLYYSMILWAFTASAFRGFSSKPNFGNEIAIPAGRYNRVLKWWRHKNEISEIMGFVRIFWKNNVQEAYLPKMTLSGQIVSEMLADYTEKTPYKPF